VSEDLLAEITRPPRERRRFAQGGERRERSGGRGPARGGGRGGDRPHKPRRERKAPAEGYAQGTAAEAPPTDAAGGSETASADATPGKRRRRRRKSRRSGPDTTPAPAPDAE